MPSTTSGRRHRRTRWLARREGVDYGPYTGDQLLAAIAAREIDLETPVAATSDMQWSPVSAYADLREHYDRCRRQWELESVEADATRHEQRLKAMRVVKGGTWRFALVAALAVLALGGYMAWRLVHARPTGLLDAVAVAMPASLPVAPPVVRGGSPPISPEPRAVPVLSEPQSYDTAGVATEGGGPAPVTSFDFDADPADELSEAALTRITEQARKGLAGCAGDLAGRRESFTGTRVTFLVRPGRLSDFTVGKKVRSEAAFKACIKKTLRGVAVPSFGGSQRRVTIPLAVRR